MRSPNSVLWLWVASVVVSGSVSAADHELYDPARLVEIDIEIAPRDWDELCGQTRNFVEALTVEPGERPYSWFRGDVTINGQRVSSVGVRKKGFIGSQDDRRPSLKLKFDEFVDDQRFDGISRLTLNNNKQDRSFASQYLTYRLFRSAGLPAPLCNFAKVTVNGENLGIYANVESVKEGFLQREFKNDSGHLYEGTLADFFPNRMARFEAKTRATSEERGKLRQMAEVLADEDPDLTKLQELIDLKTFIRFWAMESLIGFWDGYTGNQNNFFVYDNPADSRLHFVPWGADAAFDRSIIAALFRRGGPQSVRARALLPHRLYHNDEMRARYFATLRSLLESIWDEKELLAETERMEKLLAEHTAERQADFPDAIGRVREYIGTRRKELLDELADGTPEWTSPPGELIYAEPMGRITGTFETTWHNDAPEDVESRVALKVTYLGKPVEFTELRVTAGPYRGTKQPGTETTEPAALMFEGKRKRDGKVVKMTLQISEKGFRSGNTRPTSAQGNVVQGEGFSFFNPPTDDPVCGRIELTEAAMEDGAPVSGRLDATVYKVVWFP